MLNQFVTASVYESKCGNDIFQVKIFNGLDLSEMRYELYYKLNKNESRLIYKSEQGVFFDIACMKNAKKYDILIFQEHCYGNGCPELIYGVFDISKKIMLIKPSDWPNGNYNQVKRLIGYNPPFLSNDKRTFCCDVDQYEAAD